MRLAIVASHPIQYQAPVFRRLAQQVDLKVFYAHRATPEDQAAAGFGVPFEWDIDLLSGYAHEVVANVSKTPGTGRFLGCDTPQLADRLVHDGYAAVLVMGWHLKTFWQAALACRRRGIPVLVRGDSQLGTPRSWAKGVAKSLLYPPGLRIFSAALYVGQRSREYFRAYHYPEDRLFFSPHCIDAKWFADRATARHRNTLRSSLGVESDETLLLFAGKLVEFKRPLDVVRAAAMLRSSGRNVSVLVAGSGPLAGAMQREAEQNAVPLRMLGFQNQSEMPAAYAASDMLVLPSDGRETWGLVANEALACGRPVIVSDAVGCAPDLAGDGLAGRVFELGDCSGLAEVIADLADNPPRREGIVAKSSAYSVEATCNGIVQAGRQSGRIQ